jgi:ABC-type multidrug transport system ATPase subunit
MKQRLGIAAALLPSPRLLVMDEPSNGLDPAGILQIRDLILRFREEGMTVLVSSHLLSEVEQVADDLVMIRAGRMVFQGSVVDLVPERCAPGFLSLPMRSSSVVARSPRPFAERACGPGSSTWYARYLAGRGWSTACDRRGEVRTRARNSPETLEGNARQWRTMRA